MTHLRNCAAEPSNLVQMGTPKRVWAISAIHAEVEKLIQLHDVLLDKIMPGDRVVYLGNYIGYGPHPIATMQEILTFRRLVLSIPGMMVSDIMYLRGGQEEMWQKLLQLQFAPNPTDVLLWMLSKGLGSTLEGYGISPHDGIMAAQEGVMSLTRWTASIRRAIRKHPGHDIFTTQLKRAAYTHTAMEGSLLFVNAGINPTCDLDKQGDHFWWSSHNFDAIVLPYDPFAKVIRGYDPKHNGLRVNCVTATVDGGSGFGGTLNCAGFDDQGDLIELLEVS